MTTVMELPVGAAPIRVTSRDGVELDELRRMIAEQGRTLAAQSRMLEALDARREELEELVADFMPMLNAGMLMASRNLEAVTTSGIGPWMAEAMSQINRVRRAPAPGLLALARRLRAPEVRMGLALTVEGLGAIGRAAGGADDTRPARSQRE